MEAGFPSPFVLRTVLCVRVFVTHGTNTQQTLSLLSLFLCPPLCFLPMKAESGEKLPFPFSLSPLLSLSLSSLSSWPRLSPPPPSTHTASVALSSSLPPFPRAAVPLPDKVQIDSKNKHKSPLSQKKLLKQKRIFWMVGRAPLCLRLRDHFPLRVTIRVLYSASLSFHTFFNKALKPLRFQLKKCLQKIYTFTYYSARSVHPSSTVGVHYSINQIILLVASSKAHGPTLPSRRRTIIMAY